MTGTFYLLYAARSLVRNGQRSVLAIVCIAFGVLSLVALQLLSAMLTDAFLVDPRVDLGGELALRRDGQMMTTDQRADVQALHEEGLIGSYTLIAPGRATLLRTEQTGRVVFISQALGIDPASYPLVGELRLSAPEGVPFAEVVAEPGHVVVTRDLVEGLGLDIGARFTLTGRPGSPPVTLQVGGIAGMVPNRFKQSVLYSLDTARRIAGQPEVPVRVAALWGPEGDTSARLEQAGWTVRVPGGTSNRQNADLMAFMLGGAGVLGLLIGGIGVANTMQVVLARRTPEIAALKVLGYRQRHLLLLFGLETLLLGLVGGMLGVAAALLLARQLLALLAPSVVFMITFSIDPGIVASGLLTGVFTALIFGLVAMVRASAVRPGILFRSLRVRRTAKTRAATVGMYGLLVLLFGVLSSVILGSVVEGFGVVAAGIVGLVMLGLVLGALLFVATRIPVPGLPLLGLARRNLRHQPVRSLSALIALFVGVFSIGFATAALLNAQQEAEARSGPMDGYNLRIHAGLDADDAIRRALAQAPVEAAHAGYEIAVQTHTPSGETLSALEVLEGRRPDDATWNVTITEGAWSPDVDAAVVPASLRDAPHELAVGDTLHVTGPGGAARLRITGFYTSEGRPPFLNSQQGVLVDQGTALRLGSASARYMVAVDPPVLEAVTERLGTALPQTLLISKRDVQEVMNRTFRGLFYFVIAVAGLSFVAGAVLIANAVGLGMLERRRELGVLKAVGYTSGWVLRTVLLENALLGVLSGVAGLAAVALAAKLVNLRFPQVQMGLTPLQALLVVLVAVGLAVGSATLVAWRPTHLRPLVVLREE